MSTDFNVQSLRHLCLLLLLCCLHSNSAAADNAADPLVAFASDEQSVLFESLTQELRCMKCQNQTIADSQAGLASDLRREIREQIEAGRNGDEIKQYMVERYGDFILYRPRFTFKTFFLWFGPALMFLLGLWLAWSVTRQRDVETSSVSSTDIDKARSYLDAE